MRERIAMILSEDAIGGFKTSSNELAGRIVEALREEIEKVAVDSPYSPGTTEWLVWWQACQKILEIMSSREG